MKRFSVFLALPSATLRAMASRQLMVSWGLGWGGAEGPGRGLLASGHKHRLCPKPPVLFVPLLHGLPVPLPWGPSCI
jgi:hypothetical protein